jgi:release factor glutamine methyltransferase
MPSSDAHPLPPARATGAETAAGTGTDPVAGPHATLIGTLRRAGCVFAEDEARLILGTARTPAEATAMAARRAAGLPLEHVVGWAGFGGLRITLDPGVFVPRRRTEFLVEHAATLARPGTPVVDLCCGSGALGAALAAAVPGVELHAADVDPAAVRCARRNLAAYGGLVHHGDLFAALPAELRGRVAVLLANVPYVPSGEIALLPAEARDHESPVALDGGPDGLDVLRRVAAEAPGWLAPGGTLLVEAGERQARRAAGVLTSAGLRARVVRDEERAATVVTGTKAG